MGKSDKLNIDKIQTAVNNAQLLNKQQQSHHSVNHSTAIVTGLGRTLSYFYGFIILRDPTCPCKSEEKTVRLILCNCNNYFNKERTAWKKSVTECREASVEEKNILRQENKLKPFSNLLLFVYQL